MSVDHLCLGCMSYLEDTEKECPNCGWIKTKDNSTLQLKIGCTLTNENHTEKYIIGKALGQGGFGITYLAWNINRREKVVIKEYFPAHLVSRERNSNNVRVLQKENETAFKNGTAGFLNEAYKMLDFTNDPNVVSVKNFFQANNTSYIVMEYLDGKTFKQMIENNGGRMNLPEVINILTPIAYVLERMHTPKKDMNGRVLRKPLIHRDISPDNIMMTRDRNIKLLDFGSARNVGSDLSTIIKAGYSPPEQFLSTSTHTKQGAWTDVYAFAATIYHAITGVIPQNSVERLAHDDLKPPSSFGIPIENFQEKALLKGLALNCNERYQTVMEFISALRYGSQVKTHSDNDNKIIPSMILNAVGMCISLTMFIFFIYLIDYEYGLSELESDDIAEIFGALMFTLPFIASIISTACLALYVTELFRVYKGQNLKWLYNISRQDYISGAQVICVIIFVLIILIHFDTWENDFFLLDLVLYKYSFDNNSVYLVGMIVGIYSVCSILGMWLGRPVLRKQIRS